MGSGGAHSGLKSTLASSRKRGREISSGSNGLPLWDMHRDASLPNVSGPGSSLPHSRSTARSIESSSPSSTFTSFSIRQSPMSAASSSSPRSFRSARYDAEESFTRDSPCATASTAALEQSPHISVPDGQSPKRRRGIAGTIASRALNAALYTGAAAMTVYSLWSSWSQREYTEQRPQESSEPYLGSVVTPRKQIARHQSSIENKSSPPYIDIETTSEPNAGVSRLHSPKSRRVLTASRQSMRKMTFRGPNAVRQSTPRTARIKTFRRVDRSSPLPVQESTIGCRGSEPRCLSHKDSSTEEDEMMRRFEDKMNVLIAEGQAALNSTPVFHDADLAEIDVAPSHSELTMSPPRVYAQRAPLFQSASPFHSTVVPSVAGATGQRDVLSDDQLLLPEPSKRLVPLTNPVSPAMSRRTSPLNLKETNQDPAVSSVFGHRQVAISSPTTPSRLPRASYSGASSALRQVGRDVGGTSSPQSRIPRSTSFLHSRRSVNSPTQL